MDDCVVSVVVVSYLEPPADLAALSRTPYTARPYTARTYTPMIMSDQSGDACANVS